MLSAPPKRVGVFTERTRRAAHVTRAPLSVARPARRDLVPERASRSGRARREFPPPGPRASRRAARVRGVVAARGKDVRSSRWMCVASDVDLRRERGAGLGASGEGPQSTSGAARGTASARTKRRAGNGARRADAPFDRPADHGIADQTQRVHGGPRRGSALDARAGVIARPRSRAGKKETLGRTAVGRGPTEPGRARRRDARQDHFCSRVSVPGD